MAFQGLADYRKRTKKQYRGWVFNRARDLLDIPVNEANVVYLCGPEDIDRNVAAWKGFDPNKMLAVDMNKDNIKACRKAGGTGYYGKLDDVLLESSMKFDFVHADFCCGLTKNALEFIDTIIFSGSLNEGAVVSVNFQRGREKISSFPGFSDSGPINFEKLKHDSFNINSSFVKWKGEVITTKDILPLDTTLTASDMRGVLDLFTKHPKWEHVKWKGRSVTLRDCCPRNQKLSIRDIPAIAKLFDKSSAIIKKEIAYCEDLDLVRTGEMSTESILYNIRNEVYGENAFRKHRGMMWLKMYINSIFFSDSIDLGISKKDEMVLLFSFLESTEPSFYTYVSSKVKMDSVIFKVFKGSWQKERRDNSGLKIKKTIQKLAAAKAVMTRRQNEAMYAKS